MPKNLSAIKKTQISSRNRVRNKMYKSAIKTLTKKYILSLQDLKYKDNNNSLINLAAVYQKIDKAVKRGILHKNSGARKKALLSRVMKQSMITK